MEAMDTIPLLARMENALVSYCRYLGKLLYPLHLSAFYPHPVHWSAGVVLLACALLLSISIAVVIVRRTRPWLLIAWFWFAGTLVPVIGLVQVGEQAMADRYTYVPLIGVFISLVYSKVDCTPGKDRWEAAREVGKSLTGVPDEQLFSIPIVMLHVAEHPLSVPVVGFDYDLSISNLGRVNIPEQYGDLTLESIYAPTMNVSGPTHRIVGVTTFGGRMRCTFTSRDPAAPKLVRRSLEILAAMTA